MDPREMEALVQRLVRNPHDQDAITHAHQAGQSDPKSYALLLEKVGTATSDPAFACHWLTESANVWTTTLGDAHRAARALMIAIDRDPTQATPAERLADLYREKNDIKALVALLERRAKALSTLVQHDPSLRSQISGIHEELGQLWAAPPLLNAKKAIDSYRRSVEFDDTSQFAIYSVRELLKAEGRFVEAVPYFELEQRVVQDAERKIALYQDEGDVRKQAGDLLGAQAALRRGRALEGGADAALKQQLGTVILERVQARQSVSAQDRAEGAQLFVELAEEYPGEHGFSYSLCALEIDVVNDRAMQLAMYYGEQLGRALEAAPKAAAYLKASPSGAVAAEARKLVTAATEAGGDESLIEALAPAPGASGADQVQALVDMAQALVRKAKKNEAAAKFREALVLDRSNEDALGFLEPYLRQSRKFQELRDVLLSAARDESADEERRKSYLREVAGLCETQLRDGETATTALKELLAIDVADEGARAQLKRLLEKAQAWDELALTMTQEAEQETDVEARISLEKSLAKLHEQKRKDPVATGDAWARVAALASGDDEAISTAVRYFEKGERPDLAVVVITDNLPAIDDDTVRASLLGKLGELRGKTADPLGAGEAFAEAASITKKAESWSAAELAFVAARAWDQAATAIDERAQLTKNDVEKAELFSTESEYLLSAGDEPSAVIRLEQAAELDPQSDEYADKLEARYRSGERISDLAMFLLRRAERLEDKSVRNALRKKAAKIQREDLVDPDAARATLSQLLEDGDDVEALAYLAEDAEGRSDFKEAVQLLDRLVASQTDPAQKVTSLLHQATLVADGLSDLKGAIAVYERLLSDFQAKHDDALGKIADLYERLDDPRGRAEALERRLSVLADTAQKLLVAETLAQLYEGPLDDAKAAVRVLDVVRELEPENFDAVQRLADLCETLEDWPRVATFLATLAEVEGDEEEVSRMTRRRAEILHDKVGRSDEALAALMEVADRGDEPCREDYIALGDKLGWKGVVATKLVEWYMPAPVGLPRNQALKGAFDRFFSVGREADAAAVAKELSRTRGADPEIAERLEAIAVKLKDLDALGIAHDLIATQLSGAARAEEMVRQAEVLLSTGVSVTEALQRGEQALTSVPPAEVEPLLARLAKLSEDPAQIVGIYERQVGRCKAPADRLAALGRAAAVAASAGAFDRARGFFDIALGAGAQEETLAALEAVAISSDSAGGGVETLRRTLADAMAAGGQGSRDGGRTRGLLLGRAASLVHRELKDVDRAFSWLGDAIVTHVDDERLDALETLAMAVGDARRAELVLSRALEEVFDGPLVRKLLSRRAALRRDTLSDRLGAAIDLKRLHDLSPSDLGVMDQLSALYVDLADYRGMVQLFEDQILRGKEPAARAELARKVARLWEDKLDDPREAADAWRRVLRMKAGDREASEGLERAKAAMLRRPPSDASELTTEKQVRAQAAAPSEAKPAVSDSLEPVASAAAPVAASVEPALGPEPAAAAEPAAAEPAAAEPLATASSALAVGSSAVAEPEALPGASTALESAAAGEDEAEEPSAAEPPPSAPRDSFEHAPVTDEDLLSVAPGESSASGVGVLSAPAALTQATPAPPVVSPAPPALAPAPQAPTPAPSAVTASSNGMPAFPATPPMAAPLGADPSLDSIKSKLAPPPKPGGRVGGAAPPLPLPSSPMSSGGPPPLPSGRAAGPPPPPPGNARSQRPPPPPPGARGQLARPVPPPPGARAAAVPPLPPKSAVAVAAAPTPAISPPITSEDDDSEEVAVDEDELIEDQP